MYRTGPVATRSSPTEGHSQAQDAQQQETVKLTRKEKEVLVWSILGKSSWEISRIINCSEAAVNYHFGNIRRKFGVSSRGIAAFKALELGLIEMPCIG